MTKTEPSENLTMDKAKRRRLEADGWHFGDAEDFLGLTEEERGFVELRLRLSRAVRERREALNLTQQQLAEKLNSSQSRVAKLEAGAPGVSLDLLLRGYYAVGGRLDLAIDTATAGATRPRKSTARAAGLRQG
jgi:hypothetical protein